jgi:TPR repeat protein
MALTDNPLYLYELALFYIPAPIKTTWITRTDEEKYKTAYSMLKPSSDQNYPKAQYRLSELYGKGRHVEKDIIKSEELLKLSYEQGYSKAISTMAHRFIFGTTSNGGGITKDTKKGINLLEELGNAQKLPDTAANEKSTWMKTFDDLDAKTGANYLLGVIYFGSHDEKIGENYKNLSKALYYWNKAKEGNGIYTTLAIRALKENENELKNVKTTSDPTVKSKEDYDEAIILINKHKVTPAIALLESAANAKNQDAQLKLSVLYEEGWHPDNCYDSDGKMILDENSCALFDAQFRNTDYQKMIFWLKKYAEESKDVNAQYKIAWTYHIGKEYKIKAETWSLGRDNLIPEKSIESDAENAFKWFKISAENSDPDSQSHLSKYYFYGIFVPQSYTDAFDWAKLSYENGGFRGNVRSNLIHYYYYGVGVQKNIQKAGELCIAGENPRRKSKEQKLYKESEGQKCLDENNEPSYSKPKPACPVRHSNIQGIKCTYPD